jgi:3-methyladenine DNA glycosylase AlkD
VNTVPEILAELKSMGSPQNLQGMARYGIVVTEGFGVSGPDIKCLAKRLRKEAPNRHTLAAALWSTGIHDARALAYLVEDPKHVTPDQMDEWVQDFDNWAICDSTCGHLFSRTPFAYVKALEWCEAEAEFVKRAGIVLMAWLAVHDKAADDDKIAMFLATLIRLAGDERHFVKKAVNWAVRQIGKRSLALNAMAIDAAEQIAALGSRSARWIAADALRELRSPAVHERLARKDAGVRN